MRDFSKARGTSVPPHYTEDICDYLKCNENPLYRLLIVNFWKLPIQFVLTQTNSNLVELLI